MAAQWLNRCRVIRQVSGSNHRGPVCAFLISRKIFDWRDLGSIPARVRRRNFRLNSRFAQPGFDPATRTGPVSDVVSLSPSIRETRVRIRVRSNCHSEMARAIGIGTTETQRATPRNYADADGRDRRRREAAATALRMVSKMPQQARPTLKCGDKGCFYTRRA